MNYRHYYCTPKSNEKGDGFYGTIFGMKDSPLITAPSITDFEKEFHRITDQYILELEEQKTRRTRRFSTWFIIFAVLIVGMIVSCPDKRAHTDALKDMASILLNDKVSTSKSNDWQYLGAMLGNNVIGAVIDNSLYVDNYFLFSIGRITFDGVENKVSFGIFNHVFTKSREDLKREAYDNPELRKALDELF